MPIPTAIRSLILAAVAGMDVPDYNFAYDPPDQVDPSAWSPASPQVFPEETGWNTAGGRTMVGKLTQGTVLAFRVITPKGLGRIDDEMEKVDTDLKKMMAAIDDNLRAGGLLIADYQNTTKAFRLVDAFPGEVTVRFLLTWRQSRENPESK